MNSLSEHRLAALLACSLDEAARRGDRHFTGTSVVVCHALAGLPYCAMTEGWPVQAEASLTDNLLAMAHGDNPYHDGFHLLSPGFEFLKVACYLAPPIPDEAPRVSFAGRGSRFSTAYFFSLLPQVLYVGIVTHRRDVTVFRQGQIMTGQAAALLAARPAEATPAPSLTLFPGPAARNLATASTMLYKGCHEH
jgi:hypothetical protein